MWYRNKHEQAVIIINQSTGTHPQLQSTKLHVGQSALAVASASAC